MVLVGGELIVIQMRITQGDLAELDTGALGMYFSGNNMRSHSGCDLMFAIKPARKPEFNCERHCATSIPLIPASAASQGAASA